MTEKDTIKKALFLVENGFCEREYQQAQRALSYIGIYCRMASSGQGLVKSWNEERQSTKSNWGASYAPDLTLGTCIITQYDVLVIPGGKRSVEKLKNNQKTQTILRGFLQTEKPVVVYNSAINLLNMNGMTQGYSIATKDNMCDAVKIAGGRCAAQELVVSKNLVTLSRYREESEEKIQNAVSSIMNGEAYIEKIASSDNMPRSYQAA